MSERLVDVLDANGLVRHAYPVTLGGAGVSTTDESYQAKALEAAGHGELAPDAELRSFSAKMHVSRSGPLEPYGDELGSTSETKSDLEQAVREGAYFVWIEAGRPDGQECNHWNRALEQHLRRRAYVLWRQEGCPESKAEEHWRRVCEFQQY